MKYALILSSAIVASGLILAAAPAARAADLAAEMATASAHAGMAAAAGDMKMVHTHLQHVVNCLVGPGASDYDTSNADPCKAQGMGIIPDSPADKQAAMKAALVIAKEGVAQPDMTKAKADATALQAALKKTAM